jgi:hypothetical protein
LAETDERFWVNTLGDPFMTPDPFIIAARFFPEARTARARREQITAPIIGHCGYVMVTVISVSAVPGVIGQSLLMHK